MYRRILVALDHTKADESLLPHIAALAGLTKAELLLVHVADGWAARNYDRLKLVESEEMRDDRAYLERTAAEMRERHGLTVSSVLALGRSAARDPAACREESQCDLIAMTTHGHRLIGDILFGSHDQLRAPPLQDPAADRQPQNLVISAPCSERPRRTLRAGCRIFLLTLNTNGAMLLLPIHTGAAMSPPPTAEVPYGTLDLMVLKTLASLGPQHGYGIARRIEQVADGALALNQGTIYPALLRLEQKGWIASEWGTSENNRRARFYSITATGRKQLDAEAQLWARTVSMVNRLLEPES